MSEINYLQGYAFAKKKGDRIDVFEGPHTLADFMPVIAEGTDVPRMLKDRFADVVNVKDFGAKGDGVTDDTEALAASVAFINQHGGVLYFPKNCRIKNTGTHFILTDNVALIGDSGAEILHDSALEPCFIVGNDSVCVKNFYSSRLSIKQVSTPVDLWDKGNSEYLPTARRRDIYSGIFIRYAESIRISNCDFYNFHNGIEQSGIVRGENESYLITKNFSIDHCVGHNCVYLCSVDTVNGFSFTDCSIDGYMLGPYTDGTSIKTPHVLYITDPSVPVAENVVISRIRCSELKGGCIVIKGAKNVLISDIACRAQKAVAAYGVKNAVITGIVCEAFDVNVSNSFPSPVDIRSSSNVVVDGVSIDSTAEGVRCYAVRISSYHSNNGADDWYNGWLSGEDYQSHDIRISNITINSIAHNTNERVDPIEIRGAKRVDISNITIVHKGQLTHAIVDVNSDTEDEELVSENITIRNIRAKTDGESLNYNRIVHALNCNTCYAYINTKDLNFEYSAGNSVYGTATAILNGQFNGAWILDLRTPSVASQNASQPQVRIGLNTENIGFYRPAPSTLAAASEGTELWRSSVLATRFNHAITPSADAGQSVGVSSYRWSQLFAETATINTSDSRCKSSVASASDTLLDAVGAIPIHTFQFTDAVEKKGADAARFHVGVIAQEVASAFEAKGLDAARYGLFCHDEWQDEYETVEVVDQPEVLGEDGEVVTPAVTHTEQKKILSAGDRYGIRYEEFLTLECARLRRELDRIKAALTANGITV